MTAPQTPTPGVPLSAESENECGCADRAPPGEYWQCPDCDAEWHPEDDLTTPSDQGGRSGIGEILRRQGADRSRYLNPANAPVFTDTDPEAQYVSDDYTTTPASGSDGLETVEDVLFYKLKDLILEQSEGEWDDATIIRDAHHFANHLRPLVTREAAEKRIGLLEDDKAVLTGQLQASRALLEESQSQVAALKAALERARWYVADHQDAQPNEESAADLAAIDQALALKEGR